MLIIFYICSLHTLQLKTTENIYKKPEEEEEVIIEENIDLGYFSENGNNLTYLESKSQSSILLVFKAFNQVYRIQLVDNSYNISGLKHNLCTYSAKLLDIESYGIYNLCTESGTMYTPDYTLTIDKNKITKTNTKTIIENLSIERIHGLLKEKYMKVFIINDYDRVIKYGDSVNEKSIEIFNIAKNLIEREDWGKYNLKVVLNGMMNMVDVNAIYENREYIYKNYEEQNLHGDFDTESKNLQNKTKLIDKIKDNKITTAQHNKESESSTTANGNKKVENEKAISDKIYENSDNIMNLPEKKKPTQNIIKKIEHNIVQSEEDKSSTEISSSEEIIKSKVSTEKTFIENLKNKDDTEEKDNDSNLIKNKIKVDDKLLDCIKDKFIQNEPDTKVLDNETTDKLEQIGKIGAFKLKNQHDKENESADHLKSFADNFEKYKNDLNNKNSLLGTANLVILFTTKQNNSNIEGLTFIGGACSFNDTYSIIKLKDTDSLFYHGKVTAHEILHSLNARHDSHECGDNYLMENQGCTTCMEDDRRISDCTKKHVIDFIDNLEQEDKDCFKLSNTCGNGILDDGEECDSGLPFGSQCCTATCKLRKGAECDDRNGKCCKDCKLANKGTLCREISQNIYENECEMNSYCNGKSPECTLQYKADNSKCSDGICKKGICQNRKLLCERIDRKFEEKCDMAQGCKLVCVDDNNRCNLMGAVYSTLSEPLNLPDGMPCMVNSVKGQCVRGVCEEQPGKYLFPLGFIGVISVIVLLILITLTS